MTRLNPASEILLELSPSLRSQSWQASQTHYSAARWRAYLNRLCLYGALPWLEDLGFNPDQVYAVEQSHWAIWGLVGGSAIPLDDGARLVLLPSEAVDTDELRIPQEWIDSPRWSADYYIGVRVDPEAGQCLWGYATHKQVKQCGTYDLSDRTYSVAGEEVGDLAALAVIRRLPIDEPTRLELAPLPKLSTRRAEALIQRLAHTDRLALRLEVPFDLWGVLLAEPDWRSQLYMQRSGQARPRLAPPVPPLWKAANLGEWLRRLGQAPSQGFDQGWQPLNALLPAGSQALMALRDADRGRSARSGKRLTLAIGRRPVTVLLVVSVFKEADERVSIKIQLRPDADICLPDNIELSLLSPTGDVVQRVQSRAIDDYIQLKRFRLPSGYSFTIQVRLGTQVVLEQFTT